MGTPEQTTPLSKIDLATVPTAEQGPLLLGGGTFAMYRSPNGEVVIVTELDTGDPGGPTKIVQRIPNTLMRILGGGGGALGKRFRSMLMPEQGDDQSQLTDTEETQHG